MREDSAIISYANTPWLSPTAHGRVQKAIRQRLVAALLSTRPDLQLYHSAKHSLIAWMTGNKKICGFTLHPYDDYAWRISNRGMASYRYPNQWREKWLTAPFSKHTFELSFLGEEVPLVAVPELLEFVESMASVEREADAFKWDLFSHDQSYPHYAWTRTGGPEVDRLMRARAARVAARRERHQLT